MDVFGDDIGGESEADRLKLAASLSKLEGYLGELKEGRDKAERALAAQEDFVAGVCHEVRTQLGSISAFADLLLATKLDEEQQDYARELKRSVGALLRLADDVLDNSLTPDAFFEVVNEPFFLQDLIDHYQKDLEARCRLKGLQPTVMLHGDLPDTAIGDATRIGQVLSNLIDNAVKFTEEGEITLQIERLASKADELRVRFSVRDTGTGLAAAARERLFQDATRSSDDETGHGRGLALSAKLVEHMDGKIGCDSVPGEGSIFWFTVRLAPGALKVEEDEDLFDTRADAAGAEADRSMEGERHRKGRAHILVVEDNRVNQLLVTTYLTKFGYSYEVTDNGADAIEMVKDQDFDLVLMDVHMPDLDGLQATREIRKLGDGFETLPIIAVTANALHARRQTYVDAGMNACLTKPIDAMQLLTVITQHLDQDKARPASVSPSADNDDADLFDDTAALL